MRVVCPVCSANYEVPDQMVGAGRVVRCGKCGHQWLPVLPDVGPELPRTAVPPPPPVPPSSPAANLAAEASPLRPNVRERGPEIPRLSLKPRSIPPDLLARPRATPSETAADRAARPRANTGVWLGWAASVAIWALVLWAAYAYRAEVMNAWPPSQRLYAALGLSPGY